MEKEINWDELDKHFTLPKGIISPFYKGGIKIPRKLKKKIKSYFWEKVHWKNLTNAQRLWSYLGISNPNYKWFLIKKIFIQNGIPVPNYQLFNTSREPINSTLRFPLITKLNEIHGSVEITDDSVVESEGDLRKRLKYLIGTYQQSVLVEEYIVGTEVTAVLLEGFKKKVYLGEIVINDESDGKYKFKKFEYEWLEKYEGVIKYQKYQDKVLCEYVKKAFQILDMSDYGRFDIRIDSSGRYFFLDANTNPQLGPYNHDSPVGIVLNMYGVNFSEILRRILLNTTKQWGDKY